MPGRESYLEIKDAQGTIAFGSHSRKDGVHFFCFLLSNFGLHNQDRVTYLVYTQVLGMGISLSVFTRFRLLVRMTGDLVDLYPREKNGSECMGWKGRGRTGQTDLIPQKALSILDSW